MAVRNLALGEEARNKILAKYPHANLHLEHLDVSDFASIASFVPLIQQKYKTVDVLINNAGVAAKGDAFDSEVVKFTFDTVFR
jgi:carbonyl reductase 1